MSSRISSALSARGLDELPELLLSQVLPITASLLVTFATAKLLGPSGRGQLAFIMGAANLAGAISFGSLQVGVNYAHKTGDQSALNRALKLGASASVITILCGAGISALSFRINGDSQRAIDLMVAATGAALISMNLVVLRVRQGLGDSREFLIAGSIQSGIYAVLGIPVAFVSRSPIAVVGCWYLGLIISTIYGLRGFDRPAIGPRRHVSSRSILTASWSAHLGFIGIQFLYRADMVILGFFVIREQLGVYSIAAPIAELTWVIPEALSLLAFSHYSASRSVTERVHHRTLLLKWNLAAGLLSGLGIAITAWATLSILLPGYAAAVPLILILLPGVIIQGAARIAFSTLVSTGARKPAFSVGLVSIALCVLYVPFSAIWGISGAAVASTTIYIAQAMVVLKIVRREDRFDGALGTSKRHW